MIYLIYILSISSIIALDQISKHLIVVNFSLGQSVEIIKNFFSLTHIRNTGIAFSLFEGNQLFFIVITTFICIVLLYILYKENVLLNKIAYCFIIGGAIGNLIDRISLNYVIDFLSFNFFGYNFPVFNVADCFVTIGVFLIFIEAFMEYRNGKN